LQDVDRIFSETYVPSDSDILAIRNPTTNITFTNVQYNGEGSIEFTSDPNLRFKITDFFFEVFVIKDVGGQIQHQDMWMSAFKNVRAVLYVASLDDYHRNSKDGRNRLIESLELFKMVCGNPTLAGLPFVLIFNKVRKIHIVVLRLYAFIHIIINLSYPQQDLFRAKIKEFPLSTCSAFKRGGKADIKGENETDKAHADRCMQYISQVSFFSEYFSKRRTPNSA
jgi:hypothetical protein